MIRRIRTAPVIIGMSCLAAASIGCTSTVEGTASPAPDAGPGSSAASDVLAGLNACQALDQLNAGQGYEPGVNKTRRNECGASKPGVSGNSLALDPAQGLSEFAPTNKAVVDLMVKGRAAMKADIPTGGCAIAAEAGEHARALVLVTLSTGPRDPQACVDAQALAEKLEPLLPSGR
ncbi:hypothetical protein GCM10027445_23520 [Amycolatopsis endophytica]|uniref:DUF3558 domain-containing protein n=1 Tax=Amycolatopsis endophytica TaxID=860233 RepID=A0A853BGF4_9PSEU|nr:DUF3558 domain-containing protein [Amycolatopsis endophytica]NYI93616.1 hypothetical protein [Amycolatopsis endophytica]